MCTASKLFHIILTIPFLLPPPPTLLHKTPFPVEILEKTSLVINTIYFICLLIDEIYNLGRPFLGHYYHILSLCKPCLREVLRKFMKFLLFTPKVTPPGRGGGVMNFAISCLRTLQMLHIKFCKHWPNSS